jgi:hypothetical protein
MKKIIYFLIFCFFYILGVLTYKYQLPPYQQIKFILKKIYHEEVYNVDPETLEKYYKKVDKVIVKGFQLKLVKYEPGVNIWNDRHYFNLLNHDKINGLYLLQQARHNKKNINILSKNKIKILRILCMINNNSNYSNWLKTDYQVLMIGRSCFHEEVRYKEFEAGEIILPSGGPVASDPIFIIGLEDVKDIKIKFEN